MKKLLIMGSANIGPINILTKNLRDFSKETYQIDGLNLFNKGEGNVQNDYKYLDNNIEIQQRETKLINFKTLITIAKKAKNIKLLTKNLIQQRLNPKRALYHTVNKLQKEQYILQIVNFASNYDIVNVHYLSYWQAEILPHISKSTHVVITFWGSDLMASAEPYLYTLQFHACRRADAITVANSEMKEIVLSKFGRDLSTKTIIAPFGVDKDTFEYISNEKELLIKTGIDLFSKLHYNIMGYKYRIKVGYSAFESQNHIAIINQIALLTNELLQQVFLVIPMTYGFCRDGYKEEVETAMSKASLHGVVLCDYLTSHEAISLSVVTNIMLNLRANDAFNSSMSESLIAGALVINGAWLPYKDLKAKGLHQLEIYGTNQLKDKLVDALESFDKQVKECEKNQAIMHSWLVGHENTANWEHAFFI
jgi:hypothetical protein